MTSETASSIAASTAPPQQFAVAYRVLQEAIAAHAFPGCAFGMIAGRQVVLEDALGRFTYEDSSPIVHPKTVYDVASLTKAVATTAAAMLLYQRGLLDLDTPVADLLPGLIIGREHGSSARHVSIRHLLAHSSGLPGYVEFFRTHSTPAALLRACLDLPIEAPLGSRAEYSDPGYILLGKALEVIVGGPLSAWVCREVFDPLRMASTCFLPQKTTRAAIPPTEQDTSFRNRTIQGEVQDENAWVLGGTAGHAGLFSNVPDLLRFAQEILSACSPLSTAAAPARLFEAETIQRFSERQAPTGSSRALGWDTPSENSSSGKHFSAHSIGHLGFSGCSLWIDLDAAIAIVLLTNRTWPDRSNQLIKQVRPTFHDALREAI